MYSHELRTQQNKIDKKIIDKIGKLWQAVIFIEDQLELLREPMKVKCDCSVTSH